MNRLLVFAVLLLLGRLQARANEPAPASHEPASTHAEAAHPVAKPAGEEPAPAETTHAEQAPNHPAAAQETRPHTVTEEPAPAGETEQAAAKGESPAADAGVGHEKPAAKDESTANQTEHSQESASEKENSPTLGEQAAAAHEEPASGPHDVETALHETVTAARGHDSPEKEKSGEKPAVSAEAQGSHDAAGHAPADAEGHTKAAETASVPTEPAATQAGHEAKAEGHGAAAGHGTPAGAHGAKAEANDPTKASVTELLNYASKAYEKGRYDAALTGYASLLDTRMPREQKKLVLIGYARTLRKKGELTKAVAVYERLVKDFQLDAEAPEVYLELGRAQRALGAYKSAITRFYNVLNSTIKLPEDGAARYRQLAKTAQFEIAETYFMEGNYAEASRFYSRLRLLDLAPVDRAKAHFKAAFSLQLAGDNKGAIALYRAFLEQNPDDDNVPEAHYQLATCLTALGRPQEALLETLELLRTEKSKTAKDPKVWAYWQRRTGNQIANELYERGNFRNALNIYETLASLSKDPAWSLPIFYQMALCYERLGITDKAIDNYKAIVAAATSVKADDPRREDYADLARMSEWRLKQIDWVHNTERKLDTILPVEPEPAPAPAPGK